MLLLDELVAYHQAGVFPKNRDVPDARVPRFVDEDGTRCAVAHLMERSGAVSLAARIAAERNGAYVPEMVDLPGVAAWLDAAGLTVDEAAKIQPVYGCYRASRIVCEGWPTIVSPTVTLEAVLEVCAQSPPGDASPGARGQTIVLANHGPSTRYQPGDTLPLFSGPGVSGVSIVTVRTVGGSEMFSAFPLDTDGRVTFMESVSQSPLTLTREQLMQALRSSSCIETLASIDARWRTEDCVNHTGSAQMQLLTTRQQCPYNGPSTAGCGAHIAPPDAHGEAVVLAMIGALLLWRSDTRCTTRSA
jgi:hypothetical protein